MPAANGALCRGTVSQLVRAGVDHASAVGLWRPAVFTTGLADAGAPPLH